MSQDFHYNRYGKRYRYYMPSGRRGCGVGEGFRFRADEFDAAILAAIMPYLPRALDRAKTERIDLLSRFVARIDIGQNEMIISLKTGATITADVAGRVRKKRTRKND